MYIRITFEISHRPCIDYNQGEKRSVTVNQFQELFVFSNENNHAQNVLPYINKPPIQGAQELLSCAFWVVENTLRRALQIKPAYMNIKRVFGKDLIERGNMI